jgi:hypothetical protein
MNSDDINGRHAFDFLFGDWRITNRKLVGMTDPGGDEWVEFPATGRAWPILGGLGNADTFSVAALPNGKSYEGATLRLFDPESGLWRIWWASDAAPGRLDPPVEGRFTDGHGVFIGDDVVGDRPVRVRLEWRSLDAENALWEQAFSWDDGESWLHNWRMDFERAG